MRSPAAIGVVLLLSVLPACGDRSSAPGEGSAARPEWRTQRLEGRVAVDTSPLVLASGDDVLVMTATGRSTVRAQVSVDGGPFVAGPAIDLPLDYPELVGTRLPDGGWYVVASGGAGDQDVAPRAWEPVALRSDDGLTWERSAIDGFADDAEVHDVLAAGDRIVLAGGYRTERDPDFGGFEAHTWTSADGHQVVETDLPGVPAYHGYADETGAYDLVAVGDDLLLGGRLPDRAALWRSTDDGATWETFGAGLSRASGIYGLAASGPTLLASAPQDGATALVSHDAGATWTSVAASAADPESDATAPIWSTPRLLVTLTGVDRTDWSRPEVCYADLDVCGADPGPQVVVSEDGEEWRAVRLPAGADDVDEVVGTDDGRVLVLTVDGDGPVVHTWPAGEELLSAPEEATPPTVDVNLLAEGEEPEVGVRYHLPLYTHCGIGHIWFGKGTWRRTDGWPDYETGAGDEVPDGWPVPAEGGNVYGFATLGEDGVLDYTTEDGTVLATYVRDPQPFFCD